MTDLTQTTLDDATEGTETDVPDTDAVLTEIYERDEAARKADREGTAPATTEADKAAAIEGRDANGRFVKGAKTTTTTTDGKAVQATEGAKPAATLGPDGKPIAQTIQPSTEQKPATVLQAPDGWRADWKEQFGKLPPGGQSILTAISTELQADYTRKTQSLAGERKRYETLNSAIAPIEAEAKKHGVSTDAAINGLWSLHAAFMNPETRLQAIKQIAEDYDIDLTAAQNVTLQPRQLVQPSQQTVIPPEVDQRLSSVENAIKQEREGVQRRDTATAQAWIDEKAEDGSLKRPHFEALHATMKPLIFTLRQQNPDLPFGDLLQRAYDAACATDPTIRQGMIDAAAAAKTAQAIGKDRTRGTRAAAASAVSVTRAGGSRGHLNNGVDVDATLNAIYDKRVAGNA